jgi:3-deoxy-D-manno-octulosonic-acid transferase
MERMTDTRQPAPMPARHELPPDARRSLFIYNLFFPLVFLALLPGYLARMLRRGGYREKFGQRFGRFSATDRAPFAAGEWIWIHSISVGETLLALKLARQIHALDSGKSIVLSVTTSTGFAVAQPAACDWLEVIYNPLDLRSIVRRVLDIVRPRRLIFIEAIWPNLLAEARQRSIPSTFLPRLSPRSERRFRRFRALTGPIFRLLDGLAVPEPADVDRWHVLGVTADRIAVTGNSKFDHVTATARTEEFRTILQRCGVAADAPVLLAGSTFPGEERIVAEVFRDLRAEFPTLFLIVVPRHVERTDAVLVDLRPLALRITLRTALHDRPADVLLVNTTGELRDWYHLASVVFIGKSLTSTGGQNPVEPVLAGAPVIFGPHMENFEPIASQWLAADAAIRIHDATELRTQIATLLRDPARRAALNSRARAIAAAHQGATERTARHLLM